MKKKPLIAVCGSGTMGVGIAQSAAQAGHDVWVYDMDNSALCRGRDTLAASLAKLVTKGKLDNAKAKCLEERVGWTQSMSDIGKAQLIVEAIVEQADIKLEFLRQLEGHVTPESIIATNTSSLSVTMLARALSEPGRFVGLHFFNPAQIMKLVEVVPGLATSESTLRFAFETVRSWGKVPVETRDLPGFIVNRVARPFYAEAWRALEENVADAHTIDSTYREIAGFRMGPLELGDLIGHDVNFTTAKMVFDASYGRARFAPSAMQKQYVDSGRLGRKTGLGVYDYSEATHPPDISDKEINGAPLPTVRTSSDADPLLRRFLETLDVPIENDTSLSHDGAEIGSARIQITNGETARQISNRTGVPQILIDYVPGRSSAKQIAFAASCERARETAASLCAVSKRLPVELKDRPGLLVSRTLAQIANSAADAVRDGIGKSTEDVDQAMQLGANYPFGPVSWAKTYGIDRLIGLLETIASETGEPKYFPSEQLRAWGHTQLKSQ